jgi:hypothetical protein
MPVNKELSIFIDEISLLLIKDNEILSIHKPIYSGEAPKL